MEMLVWIIIGLVFGFILGFLFFKVRAASNTQSEKEGYLKQIAELEKEYANYKGTINEQLKNAQENIIGKQADIQSLKDSEKENNKKLSLSEKELNSANATLQARENTLVEKNSDIALLKKELEVKTKELNECNTILSSEKAKNESLTEKLETQKNEVEELGKKFNLEFENIANKILETKTQKFTDLNKTNLKEILEPLGKNIDEFKKTVNETYDKESKERFSLGEKVKELALLNQVISDEARNLTKALKGESKTQGRWGEMILESILEKSGLRKGEEYFLEFQLTDTDGKALRSDSENKKMRPDAVIKYPDNRTIIIDSKVSLNAFTRYLDTDEKEIQKTELQAHLLAVKNHINTLSSKGYDDYAKSLDFVMMFIPSEPAYMAAMQSDPDLWSYAYDKRIILINPTNLIISLKLVVDLWKRDNQNRNAQEIADRGAKLYDKFVGFVSNMEDIGKYIDKSKDAYTSSYKQLTSGNDNLVLQSEKLRSLGVKNKKELPKELLETTEPVLLGDVEVP